MEFRKCIAVIEILLQAQALPIIGVVLVAEVGVLTTGHTGEAACVIEAVQSLAGIIRPVHAFPTLHTGSCRDNGGKHSGHKHAFSRVIARRLLALRLRRIPRGCV